MRDFLKSCLGRFCLSIQGDSTEAGIRQKLKADAIPVLFDEAESNTMRDRRRIQSTLALMRQASTETGMVTLKGTSGHGAVEFNIRSMFCLSSINVNIKQKADDDRITVLALRSLRAKTDLEKKQKQADWEKLRRKLEIFTPEYSQQLIARSLDMVDTIRENTEVMSTAVARKFGTARFGDQYGHLLAGAYSLNSDDKLTLGQAQDFISEFNWSTYAEKLDDDQEGECLQTILETRVRIDGALHTETVSIGQLLNRWITRSYTDNIKEPTLDSFFADYGFKKDKEMEFVQMANNAQQIKKLLDGTPFADNYANVLRRIEGVEKYNTPIWFGPAVKTQRCIGLPFTFFKE
jgi:putative DNA primase/helicase